MKKAQAIRFWKELQESTDVEGVIRSFHNKTGYGSQRTLERYVQAGIGFSEGVESEELTKRTGWSPRYLGEIHPWWAETRSSTTRQAVAIPLPKHQENIIFELQRRHHDDLSSALSQILPPFLHDELPFCYARIDPSPGDLPERNLRRDLDLLDTPEVRLLL